MSDLNRYYVKLKLTYEYEVIATSSEQAEEIWEMLDYAVAFHKGTGTVNYFWDMMAELVKPEDLQILKERAEAIIEGGADK